MRSYLRYGAINSAKSDATLTGDRRGPHHPEDEQPDPPSAAPFSASEDEALPAVLVRRSLPHAGKNLLHFSRICAIASSKAPALLQS